MALLGRKLVSNVVRNGLGMRRQLPGLCSLNQNINKNGQMRSYVGAYDSDGKTTMNLLNSDYDFGLMINTYSQLGFRLNNNIFVLGPMAIFPKTVLSWNVDTKEDVNEESLRLIQLLDPKIDLLIVGIGDDEVSPAFNKKVIDFMRSTKINVEVLRTDQACSTFNFLNAENRMVAALLIPPVHLKVNEDDLAKKTIRQELLTVDDPLVEKPKIK